MTDDQVRDVRDLTRKAGINPTTTRVTSTHPLLQQLAPGERSFEGGIALPEPATQARQGGGGRGRGGQGGGQRNGSGTKQRTSANGGNSTNGQRRRGAGGSSARPASGRPASTYSTSSRPARSAASFSEGASRRSR